MRLRRVIGSDLMVFVLLMGLGVSDFAHAGNAASGTKDTLLLKKSPSRGCFRWPTRQMAGFAH
jgi:hypothetical protein